jgi:hypothetical protein
VGFCNSLLLKGDVSQWAWSVARIDGLSIFGRYGIGSMLASFGVTGLALEALTHHLLGSMTGGALAASAIKYIPTFRRAVLMGMRRRQPLFALSFATSSPFPG